MSLRPAHVAGATRRGERRRGAPPLPRRQRERNEAPAVAVRWQPAAQLAAQPVTLQVTGAPTGVEPQQICLLIGATAKCSSDSRSETSLGSWRRRAPEAWRKPRAQHLPGRQTESRYPSAVRATPLENLNGKDQMGKQVHSRSLRLRGLLLLELLCDNRDERGYLGMQKDLLPNFDKLNIQ